MIDYLRKLWRVTAIRLSVVYIVIFGFISVAIITYMMGSTANALRKQYQASIDREVTGLARIYRSGGLRFLVNTLERRIKAPGANLYVVADKSGQIIAGNVPELPPKIMNKAGWTGRPFRYTRFGEELGSEDHRAIAKILEVPNGMRLLVGRDLGEFEKFRRAVTRSFQIALLSLLVLAILTWAIVGRRALKRVDDFSQASTRIMAGDRTERLPVIGTGDEFDRLSESLNDMLERINRLDAGVRDLSDNIAHDLKTPITRLRSKAEQLLMRESANSNDQDALAEIVEDCDRIVKTFDALLTISRVESGATVAKFSTVNVVKLVREIHELFEAPAEDTGAELRCLLPENMPNIEIKANRELLAQALSNLIDNALKYAPQAERPIIITLSLINRDDEIKICVEDNGPGVPSKDLERITDRFVRLESSRTTSGNGLGLALVNVTAEMHGGKLELADNKPGLRAVMVLPKKNPRSLKS